MICMFTFSIYSLTDLIPLECFNSSYPIDYAIPIYPKTQFTLKQLVRANMFYLSRDVAVLPTDVVPNNGITSSTNCTNKSTEPVTMYYNPLVSKSSSISWLLDSSSDRLINEWHISINTHSIDFQQKTANFDCPILFNESCLYTPPIR